MRLQISRNAAEERLVALLSEAHMTRVNFWKDYCQRKEDQTFESTIHVEQYRHVMHGWIDEVQSTLRTIFPTRLEFHTFSAQTAHTDCAFCDIEQEFGILFYQDFPMYIDRLKDILDRDLPRYTDLPITDRLYIEDVESFSKVRDVNPSSVSRLLSDGFLDRAEDEIQMALEQILDVPFHQKDWGGEVNDLYTANVVINGARRSTAFLLKGPGIGRKEMTIANCGKNGDQLVRLFSVSADLFVIQYVGPISEMLIRDVHGKVLELRARGRDTRYLMIDGQDTARLLAAYGKI